MKSFVSFVLIVLSVVVHAQGEITNVSVNVDVRNASQIEVVQELTLNLPDSVKQLEFKALKFKGAQLKLNTIKVGGNKTKFSENHAEELQIVTINSSDNSFENIELNYTVITENQLFYLPIYFTNLTASSSDNDFFKAELKMTKDQNILMHFPKVDMNYNEIGADKIVNMQVPAVPSLFRIELSYEAISKASITTIVDWLVGFIFVIIGIIIWKKRDQLRYG